MNSLSKLAHHPHARVCVCVCVCVREGVGGWADCVCVHMFYVVCACMRECIDL